ncbi:radical SAM protein [Sinorhizobium medicae]|uniref:radical SAM protein n=1 Tax=Sinorhizobium medicae TaxID=110321 RepID=UPI001AADB32D|nr:radical SAM protein [Sinorhizobium medicae]MBO1944577.1 radical SAM protein [Sinorhizobium medicae]MDX0871123.1 radical SAM protein [Sinorhizobium medicae]MDX0888963.1 radical SAM protein [Sinorhizobium medicae]MDX0895026.1 radical SAM protein [Sinorhizobium medicae]
MTLIPTPSGLLRFNEEYFGYVVGYPSGDIVLAQPSARSVLEGGGDLEALKPHLLSNLDVRTNFHLNTPPLVWLELTRRCNLTCPHCYIDGGHARDNELSTDQLAAIIDDLADMGVWAVAITGGEPTLHSGFVELVRHARRRNLLVGIATHGLHLSEALLKELPTDGVIISVSIDDLHVANRKPDSEFRAAARALLLSREMGFEVNVMTNTHRKNIDKLEGLIRWAQEHDVSVRSVPFSPLGRGKRHRRELENRIEDVEKAARFWLEECQWEHAYHERVGLCVGSIFNYGLSLAYMTRRCSSGRYLAYICSDGTVYPCTMCAGEQILSPGKVGERSFSDIWRSNWEIRQFSWDNFRATCEGCVLDNENYYCASRCPAMSHARHGKFFSCGASDFEIASTVVRTAMLNATDLATSTGAPLVPLKGE